MRIEFPTVDKLLTVGSQQDNADGCSDQQEVFVEDVREQFAIQRQPVDSEKSGQRSPGNFPPGAGKEHPRNRNQNANSVSP